MLARFNHVGLEVSDVERSLAFYCGVLDAKPMVMPIPLEGTAAEDAMGMEGVALRLAIVELGEGGLELFQFTTDQRPDWATLPRTQRLPHFAVTVEDTDAALARAEALGGRRLWKEVGRVRKVRVIYLEDPDGNVLELLDGPMDAITSALVRWFPDGTPPAE